ncbi:MAG TPA: hypothetical protein VJ673_16290 [Aromatoleum sp.]|uniref:hypothetical protein n=1 Tax=Aromatoleum sp. TaxID=2307007 RepID=UPI002B4922B0|nr:hypothetical protein [Aromatoleum sp.]HJV27248.1 hypothetical protein [Aromatoleum sp.]
MSAPTIRRTALAAAATLLVASTPAFATHSWGGYHWGRTTKQFTLQLGNNLTTVDWRNHLLAIVSDWNSPDLFGATFTPVLTAIVGGKTTSSCSMVAGTTQVCNARYGTTGWLGLASINISGAHITRGTAKMNDTYFTTTTYNTVNEKRHVMCQEVAHTFGLAHQSETGASLNTCMDYFSNTGANATKTISTRPNYHDFEELNMVYGHVDGTTTYTAAAATAAATPSEVDITDDPQSWGQLVRQSANGRSSEYERNNRDGSVTLTHVYWTVETAARCPGCDHRYEHHDKPD